MPPDDRCFLYGDGLFETLLLIDGRIVFADRHRERLQKGAERLAIEVPGDAIAAVRAAVPRQGAFVARLTVSRGSGPRGYGSRAVGPARLRVRATPLGRDAFSPLPPVSVGLSTVTMAEQPLLAGLKHCNRLEQVLAADEATRRGLDECLLLNQRGLVQCAIAANVFVLFGKCLLTPPCERSGVAGTRRAIILEELAERSDMTVEEGEFGPGELRRADGLLLTSAVAGLRLVSGFEELSFDPHESLLALQAAYGDLLQQQCRIA